MLNDVMKRASKLVIDNSPAIATAIGVVGTVATAYLAGKASFEAAEIIRNYEDEIEEGKRANLIPDFSFKEKVDVSWKLYIPAVASGALTVTAIIVANRVGTRRAAAMASAYMLSEKAFEEYRSKVVDRVGSNKEQSFRDELAQDRVTRNPVSDREVIIAGGQVLCYEMLTGRYFMSDMETLKKAQNDLNYKVINDAYASLGDFYNLLGLPTTAISDEVGWSTDKLLELEFSTTLSEDGRPCIAIAYRTEPIRDYFRFH